MKSKKKNLKESSQNKLGVSIALFVVILLFAVSLLYFSKQKLVKQNYLRFSAASNNKTPAVSAMSTILFNASEVGAPGTPITKELTDSNGKILKRIYSTQSDNTYDTVYDMYYSRSKGTLLSDEIYTEAGPVAITKWALFGSDGQVTPVVPSVMNLLKNTHSYFVLSDNTIVAAVPQSGGQYGSAPIRYSEFNVSTGKEKILLQIAPLNSVYFPYFSAENIDVTGTIVSLIVSDARINNQAVVGTNVLLYNLKTDTLTVRPLSANLVSLARTKQGYMQGFIGNIDVSDDGNLFVYQTEDGIRNGMQAWATHIYNIQTQKDIKLSSQVEVIPGSRTYIFSPDDKYMVLYANASMDIVSTHDGKIVKSFNLGDQEKYHIAPVDWTDTHTLAYITYTAVSDATFDLNHSISHTINLDTHQIFDYPSGIGSLGIILYK